MSRIVEFEVRSAIEEQARGWLIRLDGDRPLTDEERDALREWLGRSTLHRQELQRLAEFWTQANILTELAVPLHQSSSSRRNWRAPRGPLLLAVASVVFISMVVSFIWLERKTTLMNGVFATGVGQQHSIVLPDDSTIQLNTDSQVEVAYSDDVRRIRLLRGEALFSVKHEAHRVFEVDAGNGIVRAVGTAFSVHLTGGGVVNVIVTQGVVDVSEKPRGLVPAADKDSRIGGSRRRLGLLHAGEASTFGAESQDLSVVELAQTELQRRMAWHEGYLVFSGEPLSEVVEQVNRYSTIPLRIADPTLSSVTIGGRFRVGDLDAVLDVLHANFGIQSHRLGEERIELDRQPSR